MDKIYKLEPSMRFEALLRYKSGSKMETTLCGYDPAHCSKSRWSRPLELIAPLRSQTDFEWTVYCDLLTNPRIAEDLSKSPLSGFEFYQANPFTTSETPHSREILELRVQGWGGVAPSSSGVRVLQACPGCEWKKFSEYSQPRKLFSVEAWDGSDFFIIWPLPRYYFVTGAVRDLFIKRGYTGVTFIPLHDLPRTVAGTLTPGALSDWFDEKRTAEIIASGGYEVGSK